MGAPVVHFEIMGGNGVELETFYSELFGWKINSDNPMKYGIVDTGGAPGGINGGVPGGPKHAMSTDPAGNVTGLILGQTR